MSKKTLAGFAATAMMITGGLVTASPGSAGTFRTNCPFRLVAPDKTTSPGYVYIIVDWRVSSSGASVLPGLVKIGNDTGRSITLRTDRWQNSAGTTVQRGPGGKMPYTYQLEWKPTKWIPKTQSPYVSVAAYATTRPGMDGYVKVTPTGCNYVL